MAETTSSLVKDLVEAGIHFGQRSASWNPKMGPYIYGKRNQIHIIDLRETVKGLLLAKKYVTKVVQEGKDVCFVGTKRQAREVIKQRVTDVKMHWVIERWLGGTLTNFRTIRSRLKRLIELERIEESGELTSNYSKKMESQLRREKRKILRNLEGIRNMSKLPGVVVCVDVTREANALMEARKLGIPTICLIDTDGDPDMVDIPIPGNDDSMRSIDVIIRELCDAIAEGKNQRMVVKEGAGAESRDMPAGSQARSAPRRSRRAQYRAEGVGGTGGDTAESVPSAVGEAAGSGNSKSDAADDDGTTATVGVTSATPADAISTDDSNI